MLPNLTFGPMRSMTQLAPASKIALDLVTPSAHSAILPAADHPMHPPGGATFCGQRSLQT